LGESNKIASIEIVKLKNIMDILDNINTIVEGTPKPPYPEIYKLSGEALSICNQIIKRRK